jgi:hypothetical protein
VNGGELIRAALISGSPDPTSAGTRVRQDAAKDDDPYPFIIFRRIDVDRQRGLGGGLLAMRETFQVECWGENREESDELESQAVAALEAAGFYPDGNEVDGIDPEVKVRAGVFTLDVWTTPEID